MNGQIINVGKVNYSNAGKYKINYVQATPSGASMNVVLTDTNGVPFFHGKCGTVVESKGLSLNGQEVNGIKCPTFANCTRIIIGVDRLTE